MVQIFVRNPRSWVQKVWTEDDCEAFGRLSNSIPVIAHLTYLPNLAKIDEDEKHMKGFIDEVELCIGLAIETIIIHCGSHQNKTKGMEMVSKAINHVILKYGIHILIENSAGQGNSIGKNLTELSKIYDQVENKENVSLCLDTAHLFASGYDIRTPQSWNVLIKEIDGRFGQGKIGFFHLNDSKTGLGSRVDRHWHIGKGSIGSDAFKNILNDVRFENIKGVMETPKINNMDEANMKIMRSLLSPLVPSSPS